MKKNKTTYSPLLDTIKRIFKRPEGIAAIAIILLIILIAIFADVIVPYEKAITPDGLSRLQGPSAAHWFGTDSYGRDLFARVIHGTRIDLFMAVSATMISITIGTIMALMCAHFGGAVDSIIMRIADILSSIPGLVLALAICAGIGRGMWPLILCMIVGTVSLHTRMIRSAALSVGGMEYIESAKALGASTPHIMWHHYIPNVTSVMLLQLTQNIAIDITMGATLSFIGLGVKTPTPEWGMLLSEGMDFLLATPWAAIFPGIFVVVTSLAIATFGDVLRDALDPKLKGKA